MWRILPTACPVTQQNPKSLNQLPDSKRGGPGALLSWPDGMGAQVLPCCPAVVSWPLITPGQCFPNQTQTHHPGAVMPVLDPTLFWGCPRKQGKAGITHCPVQSPRVSPVDAAPARGLGSYTPCLIFCCISFWPFFNTYVHTSLHRWVY